MRAAPHPIAGAVRGLLVSGVLLVVLLGVLLGALLPARAAAAAGRYGSDVALAQSQAAIGRRVGDHRLRGTDGTPVTLASLRGRPLVLSLVYTSCYGSCGIVTRRLARAVAVAREALGEDSFRIVTVGFDAANDSPQRMAAFARQQGIGDDGWGVLAADAASARALAGDVGFTYTASPRGFDHVSQLTVLDASGKVYRQVYGDGFPTPALVEPLKELIWGAAASAATVDGWLSGLKLLCTVYDPAADRYRFDYSVIVGAVVGALCLGAVAVFVLRAWPGGAGGREAG